MLKHLSIQIYGQVIGVGFRGSAAEKAAELGVKGFVENAGRDYVNIEAEGEEGNLQKFLTWCRKGPLWAKVERVETSEGEVKNYTDFQITG
ncbi:MAG: acylphosphatase [Patescibacteria group bacterium]|nr:acylphosphatase [Patescibacteria group bacterium]